MKRLFTRSFLYPDDGAPAGGAGDTPPADTPPADTPPAETPPAETPKYSDKQLNDLIVKGVAKELGKAGVKDLEEFAEIVKTIKAPKTPAADDPTKAELEALKKTTGELVASRDRNEALALAMKAGITEEAKLERVVKLAMSSAYEGTIAERIQAIVTETPEFVKVPGVAFGQEPKNQNQDATESVLNAARRAAGISAVETPKK